MDVLEGFWKFKRSINAYFLLNIVYSLSRASVKLIIDPKVVHDVVSIIEFRAEELI